MHIITFFLCYNQNIERVLYIRVVSKIVAQGDKKQKNTERNALSMKVKDVPKKKSEVSVK